MKNKADPKPPRRFKTIAEAEKFAQVQQTSMDNYCVAEVWKVVAFFIGITLVVSLLVNLWGYQALCSAASRVSRVESEHNLDMQNRINGADNLNQQLHEKLGLLQIQKLKTTPPESQIETVPNPDAPQPHLAPPKPLPPNPNAQPMPDKKPEIMIRDSWGNVYPEKDRWMTIADMSRQLPFTNEYIRQCIVDNHITDEADFAEQSPCYSHSVFEKIRDKKIVPKGD